MTAVANAVWTAAQFNTHVRDNLLETAPAKVSAANQFVVSSGANALTTRTATSTSSTDDGTSGSLTYTSSLTGSADDPVSVTITTGSRALVYISAFMSSNTANAAVYLGCAVSGATTTDPSDTTAAYIDSLGANNTMSASTWEVYTLTPGSNTFTLNYKVSTGTGTWNNQHLIVIAL